MFGPSESPNCIDIDECAAENQCSEDQSCKNIYGSYQCIEPVISTVDSCLVLATTENQGRVIIALQFKDQPDQDFGEQYIADHESWSYCFPPGDLSSFTLQNEDGNSWVGEVYMTHPLTDNIHDPQFTAVMQCENCDCQCDGLEREQYEANGCGGECQQQAIIQLGIDNDSTVEGNTKCRFGNSCPFVVSWVGTGMLRVLQAGK